MPVTPPDARTSSDAALTATVDREPADRPHRTWGRQTLQGVVDLKDDDAFALANVDVDQASRRVQPEGLIEESFLRENLLAPPCFGKNSLKIYRAIRERSSFCAMGGAARAVTRRYPRFLSITNGLRCWSTPMSPDSPTTAEIAPDPQLEKRTRRRFGAPDEVAPSGRSRRPSSRRAGRLAAPQWPLCRPAFWLAQAAIPSTVWRVCSRKHPGARRLTRAIAGSTSCNARTFACTGVPRSPSS